MSARWASYDSSLGPNYPLLGPGSGLTLGPIYPDRGQNILGSYFTTASGVLLVEQSLDGIHWDIVNSITVTSGIGNFSEAVIAPLAQVQYTSNGLQTGAFRLYVRSTITGAT